MNIYSLMAGASALGINMTGLNIAGQSPNDIMLSPRVREAAKAFTTPAVTAPWAQKSQPRGLRDQLSEVERLRQFIDLKAPELDAVGGDPDLRNSFALYRGLTHLKTLAQAAAETSRSPSERARFDALFKQGLAEIQAFATSSTGDKLTYFFSRERSKIDSGVTVPVTSTRFDGKTVSGERADAIAGVSGSERITVKLTKSGRTDNVTLDLSTITGPITLDKVAEALNAKIGSLYLTNADGTVQKDSSGNPIPRYLSKFEVYRDDAKGDWGLRVDTTLTETVSLDDPDAAPSLVVATGTRGLEGVGTGRMLRFDDIGTDLDSTRLGDIAGVDRAGTALDKAMWQAADSKTRGVEPGNKTAATTARAVAVDSQGFSYVVGTTAGDLNGQRGSGTDDLFLTKLDSEGRVVWQRLLGANGASEGFAVAVDANDNVVVAGQTSAKVGSTDALSGQDTLVVKFNSSGDELFATQIDSVPTDGARALTTDAAGNIYVGGVVSGSMPKSTGIGGQDAYVLKLSGANGQVTSRTQFGTAGTDSLAGLAVASDGTLVVASNEDGRAVVRKLDTADLTRTLDTADLGSLNGGRITGVAVNAGTGEIALSGTTWAALSAGPATGAIVGESDGFVARLDAALNGKGVTYIGTAGGDRVDGVTYVGDKLYVTGRTTGDLSGTRAGATDGFVSRLDAATGAVEQTKQFGIVTTHTEPVGLAVAQRGPGVLSKLGLRSGTVNPAASSDLLSQTSLRPGDHFFLRTGSGSARKITIEAGDTMQSLALKMSSSGIGKISVTAVTIAGATKLQISARTGATVELTAGASGQDALTKLGLEPTKLVSRVAEEEDEAIVTPGGSFVLGLNGDLGLRDAKTAAFVVGRIDAAISSVKLAYQSLYFDETKAQTVQNKGKTGGVVSPYQAAQAGRYLDALRRLGGA